ncbi:MAG: zinc ribbon domain-containing protein [Lachnospiraceae bacterium]|nr:zinc ribbon domain-containing protein [Lachnospiraceae bacterium]
MDFFNKLGDTISSAASEIGEKTKGVTDTAKLQYEMKTKEDLKKEKFLEIGRKYYEANKDSAPEDMADLFDEIKEADERIEAIKNEISDIKGECVCPNCGARLAADSAFCSECGTKLNDIYEEEQ